LARLLFEFSSVLYRWASSVWHFRCVLDCHTSVFRVVIYFCILQLVLRAKSVGHLSISCLPKPLLFCTSAIWHLSYLAPLLFGTSSVWHLSNLAFRRFCIDEPLLFVTSDVCLIATLLLFFFLIFILCIVISAARSISSSSFGLLHTKTSVILHLCYLARLLFGASAIWHSVANLAVFPCIRTCFFVELRVFLKTCGLLVFGLVLIENCLFFADFCFADCFFSNFLALLLFQCTAKGILGVFLSKSAHFGLVFRICHPDFLFGFLADFSFCWIFLPTHFGLFSRLNYQFLACFSSLLACVCKITWHHWFGTSLI